MSSVVINTIAWANFLLGWHYLGIAIESRNRSGHQPRLDN